MPLGADPEVVHLWQEQHRSEAALLGVSCPEAHDSRPLAVTITDHLVRGPPVFSTGKWPLTGVRILGLW